MSRGQAAPQLIDGWVIFAEPLPLAHLEALAKSFEIFMQRGLDRTLSRGWRRSLS